MMPFLPDYLLQASLLPGQLPSSHAVHEHPFGSRSFVSDHSVDDAGRLVRGKSATPVVQTGNYDAMVFDPWSCYPPQPVEIKKDSIHSHYEILEEIGTGAFGVVHRCVEKSTGNVFAAKFVPTLGGEAQKEIVRNEIRTMSDLRHPALISLHDAFETEQEMVMVYEFMSGGELFEKASSDQCRMSEEESRKYIRQICDALQHMHEMSYVHLDLKPENIMFNTKSSDRLKLIDFGLATKLDPSRPVKVATGTPEFASPEVINGHEVSFYTDMWSVGVLAYILLSGLSPFGGENDAETMENVRKCDWDMKEEEFASISNDAKDFIRRLLVANPRQRLSVHEALNHPWLAEVKRREELDANKILAAHFHRFRDSVRSRYNAWPEPLLPLGRAAQFSSLRILHPKRYGIREANFDPSDALPRFVERPRDTDSLEGKSASFFCKVLSATPLRLSWWKDGQKLQPEDKYRHVKNGNDYALTVFNLTMADRGEYIVQAENEFGKGECPAFLNVRGMGKKSTTCPQYEISRSSLVLTQPTSLPQAASPMELQKTMKSKEIPPMTVTEEQCLPSFSFPLRPRLIQKNHACKLLCTVTANPPLKIEWLKDGKPVDVERVQTMFKSGVASLEIFNTRLQDAGIYTCVATNQLGNARTSAPVSVEARHQRLTGNGSASDLGNVRLMAGLVGERRQKLVDRAQGQSNWQSRSRSGTPEFEDFEKGQIELENG